ncbi:DMT family transporter [Uliginosibacterium flavum]|uniref:DMT family transporter n=1 Tax=Uliginosibacterium flavum TaxID=1396831 RepID=A0ABV2TKN8_9RHOO
MPAQSLFRGVLCALGAGLVWGLVFVTPQILDDYPPAMLAFGRYLAFGLICLPLAWRDRRRLAQLNKRDWYAALELALIGNILYYLCLAAAIQLAGGALPTLIIGTLPVVISVIANTGKAPVPWSKLVPPLLVIALGIALVNQHEQALVASAHSHYALGLLLAIVALACWTWYPIRNARWLQLHPTLSSSTWATAQGLATLPLSLIGMGGAALWFSKPENGFAFPLGPRPLLYAGLMLAIGLLASWLGTLLWNRASRLLPTALSGQLIVFETLAALAYAFMWHGRLPSISVAAGILLLISGVILGVRTFNQQSERRKAQAVV